METKELVIIGSGPAGLSAGIYGKRAMLDELVVERDIYGGGQIAVTEQVDNYPGLNGINGYELAMKFREHAEALQVPFLADEVVGVERAEEGFVVKLANNADIAARAVFVSTGASYARLGCKGEQEFAGSGVSYCATCDGAFFKGKRVAVVGGGNVALSDALYMAKLCERVYLIHRRETLRGAKNLQQKVFDTENIEFMPHCEVKEIKGELKVEALLVENNLTHDTRLLSLDGVFIAIGMRPNSELFKGLVRTDEYGYIVADESCRSSERGIYAIGDVRTKSLRQVVTAVSDGAAAINSLEEDINRELSH